MTKQLLTLGVITLLAACSRGGKPQPTQSAASAVTVLASSTAAPMASALTASVPSEAASSLLPVGADMPDVSATAQNGKTFHLRELKGKPVIVYFYPKDDTPGCTIEAKGIRDQYKDLNGRAVVLGVSADSLDSHQAFITKYDLPFLLLDDSSHALTTAFGVPVNSGRAKRVTFVFDAAGKVYKVFPNVNPDGHAAELLDALKGLG